jgi:hypothetical protein
MMPREKYVVFSEPPSFEAVLDQACNRLWDRKIQYSIRLIRKMEEQLTELERELDSLVLLRGGDRTR